MLSEKELIALIEKGDIIYNLEGSSIEELLKNAVEKVSIPDNISKDVLLDELLAREKILSTAVGNGIAIPHPRKSVITKEEEQRVFVCFLKEPLATTTPDGREISAIFILLTLGAAGHLNLLSTIAYLVKNPNFKSLISSTPNKEELYAAIGRALN